MLSDKELEGDITTADEGYKPQNGNPCLIYKNTTFGTKTHVKIKMFS